MTPAVAKAIFAILLALSPAIAAAQAVAHAGERPLYRKDVTAFIGEQFTNADINRDGAITKAELQAFRSTLDGKDRTTFDQMAENAFAQADIDADGNVARWEAEQRANQLFDLVDADGDGIASLEEQKTAVAIMDFDARDVEGLLNRFGFESGR